MFFMGFYEMETSLPTNCYSIKWTVFKDKVSHDIEASHSFQY